MAELVRPLGSGPLTRALRQLDEALGGGLTRS